MTTTPEPASPASAPEMIEAGEIYDLLDQAADRLCKLTLQGNWNPALTAKPNVVEAALKLVEAHDNIRTDTQERLDALRHALAAQPRAAGNGKGPRFIALAVRHYIDVLQAAQRHIGTEDRSWIDNDLPLYEGIALILEQDHWPENAVLAAQPAERPIEFIRFRGLVDPEERARIRMSGLYRRGDAILVWVNEGDILICGKEEHAALAAQPPAITVEFTDEQRQSLADLKTIIGGEALQPPHPWYGPCDALRPDGGCVECAKLAAQSQQASPRTVIITIDLTKQEDETQRVYDAIETLLHDMGQIGTLSSCVATQPPDPPPIVSDEEWEHFIEAMNNPAGPTEALLRDLPTKSSSWEGTPPQPERKCTCHPNEAPVPCQHRYALSECLAAAKIAVPQPGDAERLARLRTDYSDWTAAKGSDYAFLIQQLDAAQSALAESQASRDMWLQTCKDYEVTLTSRCAEVEKLEDELTESQAALANIVAESTRRAADASRFADELVETRVEIARLNTLVDRINNENVRLMEETAWLTQQRNSLHADYSSMLDEIVRLRTPAKDDLAQAREVSRAQGERETRLAVAKWHDDRAVESRDGIGNAIFRGAAMDAHFRSASYWRALAAPEPQEEKL